MKHYGIIGKPLGHSWSAEYFEKKFHQEGIDAQYCLYECDSLAEVKPTISQLDGCNITIPYKKAVLPFLDALDPISAEIGAVNVVKREGLRVKGYNTDWIGFKNSIEPLLNENDNNALIFGTGGAAMAVAYGLHQLGIDYTLISRTDYKNLTKEIIEYNTILINCTPLGMWPNTATAVEIPYEAIGSAHLLFDCVYNPIETLFLKRGREQGARTKNGLDMLHLQAQAAWRIWEE